MSISYSWTLEINGRNLETSISYKVDIMMGLETRASTVNAMQPDLVAKVTLYPISESSRKTALKPGYGCPCFVEKHTEKSGWDAWMQLGELDFPLGETRTVGFCFLSGEIAATEMIKAGTFYLWEMGFIGEARVIRP